MAKCSRNITVYAEPKEFEYWDAICEATGLSFPGLVRKALDKSYSQDKDKPNGNTHQWVTPTSG